MNPAVRAWCEAITIPTYDIGEPNRNPMFLEKRVYQGSSGAVYPYPVIDSVADEAKPRTWQAVFLENEYLKIMILPELGGRVQMALDKTNDYHFVYYNRVIKPALVGLAGPWISGGIEFNWPQHHRPNTFGPVEWQIEHTPGGAATVWCSEVDRMFGTKGTHGLTLHPGKAYLEVQVRLANRTDLPQSFLWWANPAVHVNENHQSMFPPDVRAVMDHGKRDSSSFPIATGVYYKVDYSPGTDISRYKNVPVPTSYMAYHSDYNFVASYDHGRQAGLLHVCDHHISPGKKQWTWGYGDFGQAWDRQLTDSDGPYIELMCGVFTDNQPDFSWLMPGEVRSFSQFFMPYKGVGRIGNATTDAALGMELQDKSIVVRVYVTSERPAARQQVQCRDAVIHDEPFDGSPKTFHTATVQLPPNAVFSDLRASVVTAGGNVLVAWQPEPPQDTAIPASAQPIAAPAELDSNESLYLAGKHLEQYRHATREAELYYAEALRRDPGDARSNMALAALRLRHGQFALAREYAQAAIARLTRHNPNPYDGEAHYLLGLACAWLGDHPSAEDAFHKATWNAAWRAPAGVGIARLLTARGDFTGALDRVRQVLRSSAEDQHARHLEVVALRRMGCGHEALQAAEAALAEDPFHFGILWEQAEELASFDRFSQTLRGEERNYLLLAGDYAAAGLYDSAIAVLSHYLGVVPTPSTPMPHYLRAYYHSLAGNNVDAQADLAQAASQRPRTCLPHRLEDLVALQFAVENLPKDARAPYYLGCLLYHHRRAEEALAMWELAVARDENQPTAWRNLGLAYFNKRKDPQRAWECYERAFTLDPTDPRVLFEWDQLAKQLGHDPQIRLGRLEQNRSLLTQRDDLYIEHVTLLNLAGRHREALDTVLVRKFHPWEGGEGKVPGQFTLAIVGLAHQALEIGQPQEAIQLLERTVRWPESLGEGKLAGIQENDIHYLLGCAHHALGEHDQAQKYFQRAAQGLSEPTAATYYNDQPPEMIFFQGLALIALGDEPQATERFRKLVAYGERQVDATPEIDFFAVSLPDFLVFDDDLGKRNRIHCHFMIALGAMGLRDWAKAEKHFQAVEELNPSHVGPRLYTRWLRKNSV